MIGARRARFTSYLAAAAVAAAAGAVAVTATPAHAAARPTTFYVSPLGNDRNPGSALRPFKTVTKARDVVRTRNATMRADINVVLYPGDYRVTEPIVFTERDSGNNGFKVVYRSAGAPGSARLVGGERITGWTRHSGDIFKAQVGPGWRFDTLYEGGKRSVKARTPNLREMNGLPMAQADYLLQDAGSVGSTVVRYREGELDPTGWDTRDAQLYIWPSYNWFAEHVPIKSVDPVKRDITLAHDTRYPLRGANRSRFFVQGALSLLDQPGEFHLDSATGTLYYWPRDGHAGLHDVIAPKVRSIFTFAGASETNRVHDITIQGLTLEATDFTDWYRHGWPTDGASGEGHQYPMYDRQIEMPQHRTGMISMTNSDHITVTESHLKNSGYSAVFMSFYNQYNTVSSNWIEHSGYAGVFLDGKYPGEGDVLKYNTLTNNLIQDLGEMVGHASGYLVMQSSNNEISHSEIFNTPRFATYLAGWRELPNAVLYARDNNVHHLSVHDVMQDSQDGSAIYTFGMSTVREGPHQVNTYDQILINYAHMHPSAGHSQGETALPAAVYCDEGTHGQRINNIKALNYQNSRAFKGGSSGSAVLNNVSWRADFDESKMDYANIGLRPTFPYRIHRFDVGSRSARPDALRQTYHADQYFINGTPGTIAEPVTGTFDPALYQTYRSGTFSYRVPVADGLYLANLRFVEPTHTAAGSRVFTVRGEGRNLLTDFDVYASAGEKLKAVDRYVFIRVTDGVLNLDFVPSKDNAILAGLGLTKL